MSYSRLLLSAIAVIFVGVVSYEMTTQWLFRPNERREFYENLPVGKVLSIKTLKPNAVVDVDQFKVLYLFGERFVSEKRPIPDKVLTIQELPYVYDAIQLLLDQDGVVVAKAWCGETTEVVTILEVIKGKSALNELPILFFNPVIQE